MSLIKQIHTSNLGDGEQSRCAPERLLEGEPLYTSWEQDQAGAMVRTGVWASTPGKNISMKGSIYELCHLLEGTVEIAGDDGSVQRFSAGDTFVMKPGFKGTWRTVTPVRKIYMIVDTAAAAA